MRNIGAIPGIAAATRVVVSRASTVVCVSEYLRRELETKLPQARGKTAVVSSGVDLDRFAVAPAPDGPPAFLCVGALDERKNVVRLADAFAELGEGTLTFAGDGPLRARLEGRDGVRLLGRVPHDAIPGLLAESRVLCQPSLLEPLGQALLEGMACGRSVVATKIGGPPEFVPPDAGILVDPLDVAALTEALRAAAAFPCPNDAARGPPPRTTSAARPSGSRRSSARRARGRSASLTSTSGRTDSSSPASFATSSACSQLSRAFSGSTPCFSRLSPVTSRCWIRARASSSPIGRAYRCFATLAACSRSSPWPRCSSSPR